MQQGLTDALKGRVTGPWHRQGERLPRDLGPFHPGGLLEDEAGGVHLSLQQRVWGKSIGNPPTVEKGPEASFSLSGVAFSGTHKGPSF